MKLREKLGRWLIGSPSAPRGAPFRRAFDAAKVDELSFGFSAAAANLAIDQDILMGLERLRGRARNLSQNNDYAKRYLQLAVSNIVGPNGFRLQCRSMEGARPDALANQLIEDSFAEWARRGVCDVSGTLSFVDLCRLAVQTVKRDGECLIRRVRGKQAGNRWRYALQLVDIDRLPVQYQGTGEGGNAIVMGVELSQVGRPVAYHLAPKHPGASAGWSQNAAGRLERVDARDVFHLFQPMRPEQRRGVPSMHTAMLRMEMLGKFDQAAMIAARRGAETLGFFVSPNGEAPIKDAMDDNGNPIAVSAPGTYDTLPVGYDYRQHDTKYPSEVYGTFVKASLRGLASGLGISYVSLANDLEGVNYSSIRAGLLDERDAWMADQDWFIGAFLAPMFDDWLEMALLAGAISTPAGSALPAAKIEKFRAHTWMGRRWAWVDPLKDVEANIAAVEAGFKSRRAVVAEQGQELDDVWAQLADEAATASTLGINLTVPKKPSGAVDASMPAPDETTSSA